MPFANNNGVKIHYEIEGQGSCILVQHGFGGNITTFSESGTIQELKKEYRLIMVDARGCGQSDKPHTLEAYQADTITQDYTTILDDLKIQKVIYLGYSMGGYIGFQCLARYALPRFTAMILGGSSPFGELHDAPKNEKAEQLTALRMSVEKGIAYYVTNYYEKRLAAPLTPTARAARLADDPQALLTLCQGILTWSNAIEIFSKINIPTFVFGGELDPRFPSIRECVKFLPPATFVSFPGKTHGGVMSDTASLLPHIKKFLAEVNKR